MGNTLFHSKIKEGMNLNVYEAKVYSALLTRGIASAGELSEISKVPRSRCYDVLEGLEKKGFVFMKIGKPIKYIAVSPEEVVETLKKQARMEKNTRLALMEELSKSTTFTELQSLFSSGVNHIIGPDVTNSIVGRNSINLFLKELFSNSDNIIIHTTEKGIKRKVKLLKKAGSKGNVKIHAPVDSFDMPKNISLVKRNNSLRLVHTDEQVLLFTTPEDVHPDKESAVWLKSKFAASTLKNLVHQNL